MPVLCNAACNIADLFCPSHSSFVWWNAPTIRFGPVRAAVSLDFCMRDPNFFCLCPVFVVNPVVLMYKKVLRPFSTSSTETQVRYILGLTENVYILDPRSNPTGIDRPEGLRVSCLNCESCKLASPQSCLAVHMVVMVKQTVVVISSRGSRFCLKNCELNKNIHTDARTYRLIHTHAQ